MKSKQSKKKVGRKPKFDYTSERFLNYIEGLAAKGFTDRNISYALLAEFGETLSPQKFNEYKNETKMDGTPTVRGRKISEALARGRAKINLLVRDTYLKSAIGGKKTKDVFRVYAEQRCECGGEMDCPLCHGTGKIISEVKAVVQEVERELPPNMQALATWLFNHDEDWKKAVIEGKKLDITSGGGKLQAAPRVLTKKEAKEYLDKLDDEY